MEGRAAGRFLRVSLYDRARFSYPQEDAVAVLKLQTCRREREKQRKERAVEVFFFFSLKSLEKSEREKRRIKKK